LFQFLFLVYNLFQFVLEYPVGLLAMHFC